VRGVPVNGETIKNKLKNTVLNALSKQFVASFGLGRAGAAPFGLGLAGAEYKDEKR
jgi:hypothetical protein